ncbi:isoflavone reductase [Nemania sp. FL0916]|nr:isoflavone reductase [Nemania sp. FL0916]
MAKKSAVAMMRIVIAGAGGFAGLLAQQLSPTGHSILVLSTKQHPDFEENYDVQVAAIDYNIPDVLQYVLQGVDLVISTVGGVEQLNLIDAARLARVRTFVPCEFEGALAQRPAPADDPFDEYSHVALSQLQLWHTSRSFSMRYTVFSCGIFYERFAPGGLRSYNMGGRLRIPNQGDYLIDVGNGTAELPETDPQGRQIHITLTSAFDVARFVAAAVELGIETWPREFRMRGARITPQRIQQFCSEVRRVEFEVISRPYNELMEWLNYHHQNNNEAGWLAIQHLLQTANGRYNIGNANLNDLVNIEPKGFRQWLSENWGPAQ